MDINLELPNKLYEWLEDVAKEEGQNIPDLIVEIIDSQVPVSTKKEANQ